jgi:hypothetical protein
MSTIALLLFSAGLLNARPTPIFANVNIGSAGPYRFLVDTGAETSLIDPDLAFRLRLEAQFQVEIQTEHSSYMAAGLNTAQLRVGNTALPSMELVFHSLDTAKKLDPRIQGILGLNALAGRNFTLCPAEGSLDTTGERPPGETIPFAWIEGRIAVKATMGREALRLILDSGSNHIVLFRIPTAMANILNVSGTMRTIEGARSIVPTRWTAEICLTDKLHIKTLPAAIVLAGNRQVDGLLPASVFKKIYIDQTRSELVVQR